MRVIGTVVVALVIVLLLAFAFGVFEEASDGPLENAAESVEGAADSIGDAAEEAVD